MDITPYKKIVTETLKNLTIDTFTLLGKGKSGITFLANNEIVIKIPLQSEGDIDEWQRNEARVLRFLEDKLSFEVPKILFTATSESGLYIIGETLLSGITFSYELCDTFDELIKNDILRQLGKIARTLHEAAGNDATWHKPPETPEEMLKELNGRFTDKIRALFTNAETRKIEEIARHYKDISLRHPVAPVLCHNDLHFYNLMFDTQSKRITGVLDFGCAGYTEPARDFHYYFDAACVLEGYGDNGDAFFADRQRFHALSNLLNSVNEQLTDREKLGDTLGYIRKYLL